VRSPSVSDTQYSNVTEILKLTLKRTRTMINALQLPNTFKWIGPLRTSRGAAAPLSKRSESKQQGLHYDLYNPLSPKDATCVQL